MTCDTCSAWSDTSCLTAYKDVQHEVSVCFQRIMKRVQKKTVHFDFEVTMSIDVIWHQPRRWNENSLNFKKTAFLFLRHVLNCCFSSCAILFWTFHFRSSKKVVVTKQSKAPSYETPNLVFCPPFWSRSILVAWTFLVFVPAFFMPVVAKPKTVKH